MDERINEIAGRVIEWFEKGKNSPYECRLNPTNLCNLKCLPCVSRGRPSYQKEKELSTEEYLKIIDDAGRMKVRRFDICGGGEPFCRSDILLLMEKIKECGGSGTISTSGILITKKIAEKIVKIEWDEVRFSINGPNAKIDDYLRGVKGVFNLSIKAIRTITSFKKKFGKKKPSLIITPIITSLNYNKVCEFVKLAKRLKVDSLILQPFMPEVIDSFNGVSKEMQENISKELRLTKNQSKEFQKHLEIGKKLAKKYGLNTNFESIHEEHVELSTAQVIEIESKRQDNEILRIPCYIPWWDLDITTEGEIGPCPRAERRIKIKEENLEKIWNGKYFNSFRKNLVKGKIPEICKTCCAISTFDNQKCREALSYLLGVSNERKS